MDIIQTIEGARILESIMFFVLFEIAPIGSLLITYDFSKKDKDRAAGALKAIIVSLAVLNIEIWMVIFAIHIAS